MHASITAIFTTAILAVSSVSAVAIPSTEEMGLETRQTRINNVIVGRVQPVGGGRLQNSFMNFNPDSIAFGFNVAAIEITLPGTTCSVFSRRIGNDAADRVACDLTSKIVDIRQGQGLVRATGATCMFCSF